MKAGGEGLEPWQLEALQFWEEKEAETEKETVDDAVALSSKQWPPPFKLSHKKKHHRPASARPLKASLVQAYQRESYWKKAKRYSIGDEKRYRCDPFEAREEAAKLDRERSREMTQGRPAWCAMGKLYPPVL